MPSDEWIKYQMWSEDGLPAKHLILCLILQNYNDRYKLQVQGRIVLNKSDLDVAVTVHDISRILIEDMGQENTASGRFFSKTSC